MNNSLKIAGQDFSGLSLFFIPPFMATGFLWFTSTNNLDLLQVIVAYTLLWLPWHSYCKWSKGKRNNLPVFSMIAFMYWLYYALPLFWGDRTKLGFSSFHQDISEQSIAQSLLMALVGVLALWLGLKSRIGQKLVPKVIPDIANDVRRWGYLRLILVLGALANLYETSSYELGEGGRQFIVILITVLPMVAFAILYRNFLQGKSLKIDKILMVGFFSIRILTGLASGWMGPVIIFLIACVAIYVSERRRVPIIVVVMVFAYILFFQPGKVKVREKYWYGGMEGSKLEKITYWFDSSIESWGNALSDPTGDLMKDLGYQSLSRTSLLEQSANVLQQTPSVVPYQYGRLYSYMAITLIPRVVWEDKPSMSEANRFYQVAYGLTDEENLGSVSISVGILTESFINFGWPGVVLVMFLIGLFLNFYSQLFLSENSGLLFKGIGIALLPQLLNIESQLAQYLAGFAQQIFLILLILLPLISYKRFQPHHRAFVKIT